MRELIDALASSPGPALTEVSAAGDFQPTGPVLANWAHKSAGLLAESGAGPDCGVGIVGDGLGWRSLAAALAAWSLSAPVAFLSPGDEEPEAEWIALVDERVCGGGLPAVTGSAAEVFAVPAAPLALGVDAPEGAADFAAEIRIQPDRAALGSPAEAVVGFGEASRRFDAAVGSGGPLRLAGMPASAEATAAALAALRSGSLTLIVDG